MNKPILSDKELGIIFFQLADGEVPTLETVKSIFRDLNHYSGELLKLQSENKRRGEQRYESYAV